MTATCPYCNAVLPAAPGVRVVCARCGESVALDGGSRADGLIAPQAQQSTPSDALQGRRPWPLFVALVLLAAAGGAVLAWKWPLKSRSTVPVNEAERRVIQPVDVPGLGYLPPSSDVVLAIQVPLLMEKLGPEAEADPEKALGKLGLPEVVVETVEKASGVGLKNVEYLTIGIGLQKASLPPQLVVVVVTRQPYDFPDLLRRTKATSLKREGRTLHVARATGVVSVHWWSPNNRVLVGTIQPRDFDDVPLEPRTGVDHFRPEIATLIRDRVADDSCAWLAASSDNWVKHISPYIILGIGPFQGRHDLFAPAERLRSVVVEIPHPADRPVAVQMELKTAAAGGELRATLSERFAGEPIEVSGEGETCRVQTQFEVSRISSVLSRLLQEKK